MNQISCEVLFEKIKTLDFTTTYNVIKGIKEIMEFINLKTYSNI